MGPRRRGGHCGAPVSLGHPRGPGPDPQAPEVLHGLPPPAAEMLTVLLAVEMLWAPHPLVLAGAQAGGQVWVS